MRRFVVDKCKICKDWIRPEKWHTGLGFSKSKYGKYKHNKFLGWVHCKCLEEKEYLENMKELPIELN